MSSPSWSDPVVLARTRPPAEVRRAVRDGELVRVRRGAYGHPPPTEPPGESARRAAVQRLTAVAAQLTLPFHFCGESAALVWGLHVVALSGRTHILQCTRPSVRNDRALARHVGELPASHRATVDGLPVTSLARTVVDCARTMRPGPALVVADAAARRGVGPDALAAVIRAAAGGRGVVSARRVVEHADGGAESPGESLTRWALLEGGLPRPVTQVPVATRLARFVVDLGWPQERVGVEFDGQVKYTGVYGASAPEAVFAEKRRQDALEEEGWRLLRVTWADLRRPDEIAARAARLRRSHR